MRKKLSDAKKVFANAEELSIGGSHTTPDETIIDICKTIKVAERDVVWDIGLGVGTFAAFLSLLTNSIVYSTETGKNTLSLVFIIYLFVYV